MIDLSGKHVFVAGGGRGIGASAARMAAAAGAAVTINYLKNAETAKKLEQEIIEAGGLALTVQADISQPGEAQVAVQYAVEKLGPLGGLVVSAGIVQGLSLGKMTVEFWDHVMAVNVRGTFLAVQAAAPYLDANGGGSIVIYTSTAGQRGSAVYSAYAASKAAQIMFMRSMAQELAGERIRVNCIAPAWTETDMAEASIEAIGREAIMAGFPLGRIGQPADVAGATAFLLSDLASFITGSTITVDGGMDMRG